MDRLPAHRLEGANESVTDVGAAAVTNAISPCAGNYHNSLMIYEEVEHDDPVNLWSDGESSQHTEGLLAAALPLSRVQTSPGSRTRPGTSFPYSREGSETVELG